MKSTYGTGCFALLNTGATPVTSKNKLLTTIAYQLDGQTHLRAGRLDLRRRLRGAVAARRPRHHQAGQRDRPARRQVRSHAIGLSGAGLRRPRRALLECRACAARCSASPATPAPPNSPMPRWKASATRPSICGPRCAPTGPMPSRQHRAARRRRHDRLRLDHAAPRRSARRAGRPPDDPGNHRARRRLPRRPRRRRLSRAGKIRRQLAARTPLQAGDECGDTGAEAGRLGAGGEGGAGER